MTNTCLYCHKPVTDDVKRLPMTDGSGEVTEKLVRRACHERLMALRRKSYGEVGGVMTTLKFIDLFAGIGGFRMAMERAGHECVGFCEIDRHAVQSYRAIYNTEGEYYAEDITRLDPDGLPEFDCLTGGFPCQTFSVAGRRAGFEDTRGTLFFDIARIAEARRPGTILLENVKGLLSHDRGRTFGTILETLGSLGYDVEWQLFNSKDYGVPQNRERVFIVGHLRDGCPRAIFPLGGEDKAADTVIQKVGHLQPDHQHNQVFNPDGLAPALTYKTDGRVHIEPKPQQLNDGTGLSHSIDANYSKGLCLSAVNKGKRTMVIEQIMKLKDANRDNSQRFRVYGLNGIAPTLSTMAGGGTHPYIPYHDRSDAKVEEQRIRRLTPKECWRLQGFPDWAFDRAKAAGVSDTQLYRQAGNSVTVPVVEAIARRLT